MAEKKHVCTGACRRTRTVAEMGAGAALLGLAMGAMVACPTGDEFAQPAYGVSMDDDDSALIDDDDSAASDDDDQVDG